MPQELDLNDQVEVGPEVTTLRWPLRRSVRGLKSQHRHRRRIVSLRLSVTGQGVEAIVHHAHHYLVGQRDLALEEVAELYVARRVDHVTVALDSSDDRLGRPLWGHRPLAELAGEPADERIAPVDADDLDAVDEWGVDAARTHKAHADVVAAQVKSQDLGDTAQSELRGTVGGVPGQPEQRGSRGYVDEVTTPTGSDHRRDEALDHMDRPHQIDLDEALPVVMLELVDRTPRGDTGDVHHDIEAGVIAVDLVRHRTHRLVVGNISGPLVDNSSAADANHRRDTLQSEGVEVGEEKRGAFTTGGERGRTAYPAGRASDQAAAALQFTNSHCRRLYLATMDTAPRIAPGNRSEIGVVNAVIAHLVGAAAGGPPPNLFTTLAIHRRLFRRWLLFAGALMPGGRLPRIDSELVILRVAHNCNCMYEWRHHERLSAQAGLSEHAIALVRDGADLSGFTTRQRLLLRAADELHEQRTISDQLWWALHAELGDPEMIELCLLIGHYEMLAMTLNSLAIVPDPIYHGPPSRMMRVLQHLAGR